MVEKRATARGEIIANRKNSPLFQKFPLKSKKYKRNGFSVAEAMIALLIGSVALGMAAPMITKQIKAQNMNDTQFRIMNNNTQDIRGELEELRRRIEELENADNSGVPVGTVAFFNSENCPDDTWQNATNLGWGGYFFRVADSENPRNTAQEQSIQNHWHNLPKFKLYDKRAGWTGGRGMFALGGTYYRDDSYAGDVYRINHNFSIAPSVSNANETRPKNIPLTTCVKIR